MAYYFLNEARVLDAKVQERPEVDEVCDDEYIQSPELMIMTEPLYVQDLVQDGRYVDQAQSGDPLLGIGAGIDSKVHHEQFGIAAGVLLLDFLDFHVELVDCDLLGRLWVCVHFEYNVIK